MKRGHLISDAVLAGIAALAVLLVINLHGYGFSWDSRMILIFSDGFSQGILDRESSYAPLTVWSLGLIRLVLPDLVVAMNVYFGLVWFAFFFFVQRVAAGSIFASLFAFGMVFGNPASLKEFTYLHSEPAYAVLLSVACISLFNFIFHSSAESDEGATSKPNAWELAFLVALSLLPMQRYAGGFIAVILGLSYLILAPTLTRFRRLLLSAMPFLFVLFWNFTATGQFSGYRNPSQRGFAENLQDLVATITGSFMADVFLYFALVISVCVLMYFSFRKSTKLKRMKTGIAVLLVLSVPLVQLGSQVYAASVVSIDRLLERFVVVVIPFLIAGLVWVMSEWAKRRPRYPELWGEVLVLVAALALFPLMVRFEFDLGERLGSRQDRPALATVLRDMDVQKVGVVAGNTKHMFADVILLNGLANDTWCGRYRTRDSYWNDGFRYEPNCSNSYPTLYPVIATAWDETIMKLDAIIVAMADVYPTLNRQLLDSAPGCVEATHIGSDTLFDLRKCTGNAN